MDILDGARITAASLAVQIQRGVGGDPADDDGNLVLPRGPTMSQ